MPVSFHFWYHSVKYLQCRQRATRTNKKSSPHDPDDGKKVLKAAYSAQTPEEGDSYATLCQEEKGQSAKYLMSSTVATSTAKTDLAAASSVHSMASTTADPRASSEETVAAAHTPPAGIVAANNGNETGKEAKTDVDIEKGAPIASGVAHHGHGEKDPWLVTFDGPEDKTDPRNWSTGFKAFAAFQLAMLAFAASLGSSIISPAEKVIGSYVGVGQEVMVLAISLYVLGFALGPLLWGPVSEVWGRRWSLLPPMIGLALFSIATAVAQNAQTVFITRFFAGVFGSAPVSNVAASMGDMFNARERGIAISIYAIAVSAGPTMGPIIGSALTYHVSWRWTEYLQAIITFASFSLALVCMPEVYPSVLLKRKAQRLRRETGDSRWHHPHEDVKLDFKSIVTKQLSRPLILLTTEPMVTLICFYASFVYGLLYMTLEVFPIVFSEQRHWGPVVSTLPFVALTVGILSALFINIGNQPFYFRAVQKNKGRPVPEARLPPVLIGSVLFTTGLFWFGWTADPKFFWLIPCFAIGFIGAGFTIIFQVSRSRFIWSPFFLIELAHTHTNLHSNASTSWSIPMGCMRQAL